MYVAAVSFQEELKINIGPRYVILTTAKCNTIIHSCCCIYPSNLNCKSMCGAYLL